MVGIELNSANALWGNLFDDPECKLHKYLQWGKFKQSGEWHFEYNKDGQLTEKYKGSGKWWDTKHERGGMNGIRTGRGWHTTDSGTTTLS